MVRLSERISLQTSNAKESPMLQLVFAISFMFPLMILSRNILLAPPHYTCILRVTINCTLNTHTRSHQHRIFLIKDLFILMLRARFLDVTLMHVDYLKPHCKHCDTISDPATLVNSYTNISVARLHFVDFFF